MSARINDANGKLVARLVVPVATEFGANAFRSVFKVSEKKFSKNLRFKIFKILKD